jgi:hypothetical protein
MTTTLSPLLYEGTTALYSVDLIDENDVAVELASLTTLTLTVYDATTGVVVNSRDNVDALNANDVTVQELAGPPARLQVVWTLQPEDTVLLAAWRAIEYHTVVLRWTWDSGTKAGAHVVNVGITNLANEPA